METRWFCPLDQGHERLLLTIVNERGNNWYCRELGQVDCYEEQGIRFEDIYCCRVWNGSMKCPC